MHLRCHRRELLQRQSPRLHLVHELLQFGQSGFVGGWQGWRRRGGAGCRRRSGHELACGCRLGANAYSISDVRIRSANPAQDLRPLPTHRGAARARQRSTRCLTSLRVRALHAAPGKPPNGYNRPLPDTRPVVLPTPLPAGPASFWLTGRLRGPFAPWPCQGCFKPRIAFVCRHRGWLTLVFGDPGDHV